MRYQRKVLMNTNLFSQNP